MRSLAIMAAALGLVGTIAVATAPPAAADWYGRHHRYYNYGGGTWNGCPPDWTNQGGVCKPYRGPHGPGWYW